jgi:ADP-heptose:LPS heptosyltransferase
MKILILQLARFGDIFITVPSLRALRRKYPQAEIHCVVRKRFAGALSGCDAVDKIWELDTGKILEPLILQSGDIDVALANLSEWLELLGEQDFDHIINLSFSPFSSYLTDCLANGNVRVSGYTRHDDGYLAIPDDSSAYFYAQVGIGRFNRYHLGEIFAAVCGVDLEPGDWSAPTAWNLAERLSELKHRHEPLRGDYVVVHMGASQQGKVFPAYKWHGVLLGLVRKWPGRVVLIGTESEKAMAAEALAAGGCDAIVNLMGSTSFAESAALISGARLLIGGDSAPMHLASFTTTRCLNLSFASVNFWETGPRTTDSRVIFAEAPESLPASRVLDEAIAMLEGRTLALPYVGRTTAQPVAYQWRNLDDRHFGWSMIQAIYSGGEWPVVEDQLVAAGLYELREAINMAVEQLPHLANPKARGIANEILNQADVAITGIQRIVPDLFPLISWFQTERLRIGPMPVDHLMQKTHHAYAQMQAILNLYLGQPKTVGEAQP